MTRLSVEQSLLLKLLTAALFQKKIDSLTDCNWDKVYALAKQQCIVALVEPFVPVKYKEAWTEETFQTVSRFVQLTYEQETLISMFQKQDIPMVIIKGTAAAMYYPEPSRRSMGDIDFFVPEQWIPKAKELMEDNAYNYFGKDRRHYEYFKNNFEFEMHMHISSKNFNSVDHIFLDGMRNRSTYQVKEFTFPGLPQMENGLVLLGHMMQHLKGSGLGLRQVIDWMMFVYHELDDEVWEKSFRKFAVEAGLEKLAITTTYLCKKWLGLPNDITWCNGVDEELADLLLEQLLMDGNLGNARPAVKVRNSMRNKGFFSYLQSAGMSNWKLAQRHVAVRPFAWLYQVCRLTRQWIAGVVNGKNELKGAMSGKKIEEIWKRLE